MWACGCGYVSTPSFDSHLNPIPIKVWGRLCPSYTDVPTKVIKQTNILHWSFVILSFYTLYQCSVGKSSGLVGIPSRSLTWIMQLKISKFWKQFMVSSILPINKWNSLTWVNKMLRIVSFILFFGELRRP